MEFSIFFPVSMIIGFLTIASFIVTFFAFIEGTSRDKMVYFLFIPFFLACCGLGLLSVRIFIPKEISRIEITEPLDVRWDPVLESYQVYSRSGSGWSTVNFEERFGKRYDDSFSYYFQVVFYVRGFYIHRESLLKRIKTKDFERLWSQYAID